MQEIKQIQEKIDFIKSKGYSIKVVDYDEPELHKAYIKKLENIVLYNTYNTSLILNILDARINDIFDLEKLTKKNPIFEQLKL